MREYQDEFINDCLVEYMKKYYFTHSMNYDMECKIH